MKEIKPDIITKETKVIQLGHLEDKFINIKSSLIENSKKENNRLKNGYWIMIEDEIYYFKVPGFTQGYINELLGEKISSEFNLETVHYQLAEGIININGKEVVVYGLLSKWARKKDYSYQMLKDIIYNKNSKINPKSFDSSNLSLLNQIDEVYQGQPICEQLRAFVTREFFTQEKDRIESEILLATKNDQTELSFLSDYEYEWLDVRSQYSLFRLLKLDLNNPQVISQVQKDPFFQTSFAKALEINVMHLLEQIKEDHKIRLIDYDKNNYKEKEMLVKSLIRNKKLV